MASLSRGLIDWMGTQHRKNMGFFVCLFSAVDNLHGSVHHPET